MCMVCEGSCIVVVLCRHVIDEFISNGISSSARRMTEHTNRLNICKQWMVENGGGDKGDAAWLICVSSEANRSSSFVLH